MKSLKRGGALQEQHKRCCASKHVEENFCGASLRELVEHPALRVKMILSSWYLFFFSGYAVACHHHEVHTICTTWFHKKNNNCSLWDLLSLSVSLRMSTQLWFSVPEICTSNSAWHFPPSPVMKDCTTQACNWGLAFRPAISTMFWIPKWARKLAPSQQHSSKCLFKWTCFPIAILYTTNIVPLKSKNRNAWSFCTNDTSRTKQVFEEWHTKTCAHNTT